MKENIQTKNIFRASDIESLRKAVTAKIEKLMNDKLRKAV